ncbi:MAG: efflux RND transporter permease subunit [bacterium]
MNLPKFSVKYPVTVTMLMLAIVILGVISFDRLGTDLLPAIYNPRIVVEIQSGERSPQEMEQRFARSLEGALGTVSKVVDVQSVCSVGRILITATFSWGTDMDFALLDVQKQVASFESDPEVDALTVARYDPQEEPIMIYALTASAESEHDLDELRRIAEDVVKRNLEQLDGVARVQIYGGIKREVRVELDEYLLQAYNLTPSDIASKITQANANASGGRLVQQDKAYLIKGIGKYADIAEVAATVVGYKQRTNSGADSAQVGRQQAGQVYAPDKVSIFLSDVAKVRYLPKERSDEVRLNGQQSVGLYIFKESQENTVRVAQQVQGEMQRMQDDLSELRFSPIYSQANFISAAIGEVKTTAIVGIILAVLTLYAFLRNLGATLIISLAIPISILATFTLMYFQKLTLNVMTLGGLALGAGMLVDNAIVVIENIFRRRQLGEAVDEAAVRGSSEVGVAIVASTLTTIIVFLPIVFVRGIAAELFKEQAWVVAFSLLSSLLVAFLLIPTLAARFFASKDNAIQTKVLRLPAYEKILSWALQHRLTVVLTALIMLAAAGLLLPVVGSEFVPRSAENQVQVEIDLPPGTPLEKTTAALAGVEARIRQVLGRDVKEIFSTVNVQSSKNVFFSGLQKSEHRAELTLNLAAEKGSLTPAKAIATLKPVLNIPDMSVNYQIRESSLQQTIGSGGAPIRVEIRGNDLQRLEELSNRLVNTLENTAGLPNVETSFQKSLPEVHLRVDRLLVANLGLDIQQIGQMVKQRLAGEVVTDFYSEGNDRDIRLAFPRMSLGELQNLPIQTSSGAVVRLHDVAELTPNQGPREIQRHNQTRVAQVTAQLPKGQKLSQAIASVESVLSNFPLPAGYELSFAGEEASRQESFSQMKFALILSVILVYMVLASLFESLKHPFTILLTLPLAGVGVVFAFLLVGEPLSVMAYIGVIMLAGIAANDAIVLVDYVNRLRRAGQPLRAAILQAGRDRLRPILMTSATTILALLPLTIGLGEGARLRAPMAIAVIGGLVTSTILTLVVIPVVYELIDGLKFTIKNSPANSK